MRYRTREHEERYSSSVGNERYIQMTGQARNCGQEDMNQVGSGPAVGCMDIPRITSSSVAPDFTLSPYFWQPTNSERAHIVNLSCGGCTITNANKVMTAVR